jgi:hypothetical protein
MALISTAGATNANSYTSVAFADTYLSEERVGAGDWADVVTATKEAALIQSTRYLDHYRYRGSKTDSAQALKFPRTGIYDEDGDMYDEDTVPDEIQQAAAELAFALTQNPDLLTSDGVSRYKSMTSEGDKFEFNTEKTNSMPPVVDTLISRFIASTQATAIRA